ncbi:hypothetical protein AAF712_010413 [Marasmius tenuissimus]|uniref:Uncharacterized protein n=1 Tax=Marasmius tenuissimus TaxID=585030 RepID=A0ABR2ZPQ4_9AGAR
MEVLNGVFGEIERSTSGARQLSALGFSAQTVGTRNTWNGIQLSGYHGHFPASRATEIKSLSIVIFLPIYLKNPQVQGLRIKMKARSRVIEEMKATSG